MTFQRQEANNWALEVPGARWLKADLHIHTIDDRLGGRAKMPSVIGGGHLNTSAIKAYARMFLQQAVARGVRVLGITPHSPYVESSQETSAVWQIVEEWNSGVDDDKVPFREKVYAVFPGFEPSLNNGRSGLHIIFLFDPEIGRTNYLKAFDLIMRGSSPWSEGNLRMSSRTAEEAFQELRKFHAEECPQASDESSQWSYIVLAPHIDGDKGLLGAQKAQVLQVFQHEQVAALELGDNKLPDDTIKKRENWLPETMAKHRQAFFHGSDAYAVDEIGKRYTWLKLASPRIEAIRQAFIASDSRVRIGYQRGDDGGLKEIPDSPDVTMHHRPWLKSVQVSGEASFFGNGSEDEEDCQFNFSPDLTCIIGGSMTGKSTLLDGLRVQVAAPLPQDEGVKRQVEARGKDRFLGGSAKIILDCPGRDTTSSLHEQWPAVFYTQTELQRLALDSDAIEDILARLVESETQDIAARERSLQEFDEELASAAVFLAEYSDDVADVEQAIQRSQSANEEVTAFSDAGVEKLNQVTSDLSRWRSAANDTAELENELDSLLKSQLTAEIPEIDDSLVSVLEATGIVEGEVEFRARWNSVHCSLKSAYEELKEANAAIGSISEALEVHQEQVRVQLDRALAARGLDVTRINQLQKLSAQAAQLQGHLALRDERRDALEVAECDFESLRQKRRELVDEQRLAFDRVTDVVHSQFKGRIAVRRLDEGHKDVLESFFKELHQKGITRWWNDSKEDIRLTPDGIIEALDSCRMEDFGMSAAVQRTFNEQFTPLKRRQLAALRCRDEYVLELKVDDERYRPLSDLSGGQRVNLLLSLLLETKDNRPLVIDQPEDELDNRFLSDTMLPVLRELKGYRQIIIATHNANIVVNGDADQVILLEATADRGHISCSGAIEDPIVRNAIVKTVDGGDDAFRSRQVKYGY